MSPYPIKYHYSNGHNRNIDWLKQYLFSGVSQAQLSKNYGYARHYISFIIRREAEYITRGLEEAGLAATCTTFNLLPEQIVQVEVYYHTRKRRVSKGRDTQ